MRFLIALLIMAVQCRAACVNQSFIDWEGGTNGTQINLPALTNCVHGDGTWSFQNPNSLVYFTNFGQRALGGTANLCNGGSVNGSGSLGMVITAHEGADDHTITFYPTNGGGPGAVNTNLSRASFGVWIMSDIVPLDPEGSPAGGQHDSIMLKGDQPGFLAGGDYVNIFIDNRNDVYSGKSFFGLESILRADLTAIAYHTNANWYWVTAQMNHGGSNFVSVYSANLDLLGTISGQQDGLSYPHYIQWRYQNGNPGTHIYTDSLLVDFDTGVFPLLPTVGGGGAPGTSLAGTMISGARLEGRTTIR